MSKRKKVAVFANEPVTGKIGGMGIRQLQIARTLAIFFDVRLFTSYRVEKHKEPFKILQINYEDPHSIEDPVRWAEVVYSSQPAIAPLTKKFNKPVAVDLLVHEYCEDLELMPLKEMNPLEQSIYFSDCIVRLSRYLDMGDFFLCSNERQRDFYLGILTLFGKLLPNAYQKDPQFRSLIDIVPFGIPKREPKKGKNLLRGKISGIGPRDFLIVWGGSLANWFDSLTPIRAMARLKKKCPIAKLVFVGNKHPVPAEVPKAFRDAVKLAKQKGVYEKNVFFYTDWVPYEQHEYYLTEANAGIVAFHDHLENYFSFRIRVVDYLWGNLPILTNPGSVLGNFIDQKNLGRVFPFGDDKNLADSIEWMVTHPKDYKKLVGTISQEKKQFHWENVLSPLIRFCRSPKKTSTLFDNGKLYDLEVLKSKNKFTADQLLRLVPSHPYIRLILARKNIQENKPKKAASLIEDHLRLFGHGLEDRLFRLPLFDVPADFTYDEMCRLIPSHPHAQLMKAKQKLNTNKLEEAEALIDEEIELFGETTEALFCRGLLHQHRGKHRKAVKDFEHVNNFMPFRFECLLPLADSLMKLKETDRALRLYLKAWKRSVGRSEEWVRARAARAIAKIKISEYPEIETLKQYQKRDPNNESLSYAYASALESAGKRKEARLFFESFTTNFVNEQLLAAAWFRLARLSPVKKQKKMLKACLKLDPHHSGARDLLQNLKKK